MPAPTNIDFASATDLGASLPISLSQDAHFGGVTYDLYFKRTCQAGEKVLGISFTSDPYPAPSFAFYSPLTYLYNYDSGAFTFVGNAARNCPSQIPAIPGETYYFKIEALPFTNPTPAILNIEIKKPVLTAAAIGNALINSASITQDQIDAGYTGLPLGYIDIENNGGIIDFTPFFICGEYGDTLTTPAVRYLFDDKGFSLPPYTPGFNYSNLYDEDLNLLTRILTAETGSGGVQIRTNIQQQLFYIFSNRNGGTPGTINSFDGDGNLVANYSSLNIGGTALAISADGLTCYISGNGSSVFNEVKPLNLATLTFGANLVARVTNYTTVDMLVLADGTFLVSYYKSSAPRDAYVKRFSIAGALLNTYSGPAGTVINGGAKLGYSSAVTPHFLSLTHKGSNTVPSQSIVQRIKVSDGTATKTSTVYNALSQDQQFSTLQSSTPIVSDTCPVVELLSIPTATGTIIVNKITVGGDASFAFTAGGGLSPTSFSLANGESQQFSDVAAGSGYTIAETPITGWTTEYVVSNGSPINNISVGASEIVTITYTNTKTLRLHSGIYKIVPGKRQDTLWGEDFASTVDVKIP